MDSSTPREARTDRRTMLFALSALSPLAALSALCAGEELPAPQKPRTLSEKVAQHLNERDKRFRRISNQEFFDGLNYAELQKLRSDPRTDLAMRAAWEIVRRDSVSKASIAEFLETARSSLGVQPPNWWEKAIRSGQPRVDSPLPVEMDTNLFPKYTLQSEGLFLQRGQTIKQTGTEMYLVEGKRSLLIPEAAIRYGKNFNNFVYCLDAAFTEDAGYLVCHGGYDTYFPFYRIDTKSGHVVWEAKVWGSTISTSWGVWLPRKTVNGLLTTTLIRDSGRILVFAAEKISAHVEGFRETDGENLFRFSTLC